MSLRRALIRRIEAEGPISVADYMAECLLHPRYGYYTTRDPLGAAGDFTTAPEISQMFGEMIGLALVQCWLDQGRPAPFVLAELGPGRGTLMADALRAARVVPQFARAARLVLVETSPTLIELQRRALAPHAPEWIARVEDLPQGPLFAIANEFFDALPLRQFLREGPGWRERRIGTRDGQLCFGLGTQQAQPALAHRIADTVEGDMVELSAAAGAIIAELSLRIAAQAGALLVIDYGDWRTTGDSFQAVKNHAKIAPLADPGNCDLTAHVDFEALAQNAPDCAFAGPVPQGLFLERLGITARAAQLSRNAPRDQAKAIAAAYQRLTDRAEMGNLFKVAALHPFGTPPPPGLTPP